MTRFRCHLLSLNNKCFVFPFCSVLMISSYLSVEVNKVCVELLIAKIQEVVLSCLAYRHNLDLC